MAAVASATQYAAPLFMSGTEGDVDQNKLAEELAACQAARLSLWVENVQLRQLVADLVRRLPLPQPLSSQPIAGGLCPASPTTATSLASASAVKPHSERPRTLLQSRVAGVKAAGKLHTRSKLATCLEEDREEANEAEAKVESSAATPLTFSFTLRTAENVDLGLDLQSWEDGRALEVEGIRPGAVEAWNRLCATGPFPHKAVVLGDRITSVNSVTEDAEKMREEVRSKPLLKLTIVRDRK